MLTSLFLCRVFGSLLLKRGKLSPVLIWQFPETTAPPNIVRVGFCAPVFCTRKNAFHWSLLIFDHRNFSALSLLPNHLCFMAQFLTLSVGFLCRRHCVQCRCCLPSPTVILSPSSHRAAGWTSRNPSYTECAYFSLLPFSPSSSLRAFVLRRPGTSAVRAEKARNALAAAFSILVLPCEPCSSSSALFAEPSLSRHSRKRIGARAAAPRCVYA